MKRAIECINGVLLFIVFGIMVIQVLCRTILKISVPWSDEMARSVYTLVVFIGAAAVTKDNGHISVDLIVQLVPSKVKRILRVISSILSIPFMVIIAVGAFTGVRLYWKTILPSIGWLTIGHLNLIFGLSSLLMIFYSVLNIINDIRNRNAASG
jgi:TRAP-type C4-dicarboxylate transport system permease small subunit